jgi:hypothetical protein
LPSVQTPQSDSAVADRNDIGDLDEAALAAPCGRHRPPGEGTLLRHRQTDLPCLMCARGSISRPLNADLTQDYEAVVCVPVHACWLGGRSLTAGRCKRPVRKGNMNKEGLTAMVYVAQYRE